MIVALLIIIALPVFLIWYLLRYDVGEPEQPIHIIEALAFGLLAVAMVPLVRDGALWALGLPNALTQPDLAVAGGTGLTAILIAAALEELLKFLPLAWFIHGRRYFNELTDGVIYFALVGVCFGLVENVEYAWLAHQLGLGSDLSVAIWRSVILLFLHAATTGIVGYYFARAKVLRESLTKTLVALVAMIGLHTLYDYGSFGLLTTGHMSWLAISLTVSLVINVSLFAFLRRAWRLDEARLSSTRPTS